MILYFCIIWEVSHLKWYLGVMETCLWRKIVLHSPASGLDSTNYQMKPACNGKNNFVPYGPISGFGGLEVACWPTQVCGFKPGQSLRIFKGKKILSTPSFGGEAKPSVPCRRFVACKRSLELRGCRILGKICPNISCPQSVLPSTAGGFLRRWM
jgi:hypothetical protein